MWIAVCSLAADWSGLHYIVGGFLAGLVINEDWLGEETVAHFRKYVLLLIMPIFFLSTGLRTDWELKNPIVIGLAIVLFVVQAFGKMLGVRISAVINGWNKRDAMTIGWLLQTKALIEIIFCTVMLDKGIISAQMFTALLFMAIFSTVATTPIVTKRLKFPLKLGHS
jgi:Kef-type K+ transport system membrane component KefB